jgi:hypothetical protein
MKTYKIIAVLVCVFISIVALVLYNAFGTKRQFTILTMEKYGICFMVSDELEYKLTPKGFTYRGGKNHGSFELLNSGLSENITRVKINGFNAGYSKEKNKRVYEYELDATDKLVIFKDSFMYASKSPMNLVPYNTDCKNILKNFPKHVPIIIEDS